MGHVNAQKKEGGEGVTVKSRECVTDIQNKKWMLTCHTSLANSNIKDQSFFPVSFISLNRIGCVSHPIFFIPFIPQVKGDTQALFFRLFRFVAEGEECKAHFLNTLSSLYCSTAPYFHAIFKKIKWMKTE